MQQYFHHFPIYSLTTLESQAQPIVVVTFQELQACLLLVYFCNRWRALTQHKNYFIHALYNFRCSPSFTNKTEANSHSFAHIYYTRKQGFFPHLSCGTLMTFYLMCTIALYTVLLDYFTFTLSKFVTFTIRNTSKLWIITKSSYQLSKFHWNTI